MSLSAEAALRILERRFDYHSARVILKQAAARLGVDAAGPFDGGPLADAVLAVGGRADAVAAALREGDGGGAPPRAEKKAAAPEPPAPAPEPEPVAAEPEAPPAEEARAEAHAEDEVGEESDEGDEGEEGEEGDKKGGPRRKRRRK